MNISVDKISALYQQACEVELQAFKPGNVSVYADGHDMTVEDFRISAKVSVVALCNPDYTLGEKIYYAVKATREAVGCNTNLGILLLCAPLIQAVAIKTPETTLQQALAQVLDNTTLNDADWVFKAISLASPGGLGSAEQADVSEMPTINLTEAMGLASLRDRIALQFVSNYQDIFDFALPIYYNAHKKWCKQDWSALAVYVSLLCRFPDSHIERKYGRQHNRLIANKMAQLSDELSKVERPELTLTLLHSIDKEFKSKGLNPGTMADLTVATVFTVFLEDTIKHSSS